MESLGFFLTGVIVILVWAPSFAGHWVARARIAYFKETTRQHEKLRQELARAKEKEARK